MVVATLLAAFVATLASRTESAPTPEDGMTPYLTREQVVRFLRDGWGPAHEAYAALSTRGRHQFVPDSGHNIMVDKPAVVISAVIEVLNESQARPAARHVR